MKYNISIIKHIIRNHYCRFYGDYDFYQKSLINYCPAFCGWKYNDQGFLISWVDIRYSDYEI